MYLPHEIQINIVSYMVKCRDCDRLDVASCPYRPYCMFCSLSNKKHLTRLESKRMLSTLLKKIFDSHHC